MTAAAHYSSAATSYDDFDVGQHVTQLQLAPDERIGPPPSAGSKLALRGGFLLLIALAAGGLLFGNKVPWPALPSFETAAVTPPAERKGPPPTERLPAAGSAASASPEPTKPAADVPAPEPARLPPSSKTTDAPGPAAKPATAPLTTGALPVPSVKAVEDAPTPRAAPPSRNDPADAYQARAEAVGLHPDLSRVLLARLSPADYRNAGLAIQNALVESSEGSVFVWPRQRKPELAHFQVRFVPGAAPGCKRYVVAITKDGWLTTALPMEKCGSTAARPRRD